jgi:hypothetical protein
MFQLELKSGSYRWARLFRALDLYFCTFWQVGNLPREVRQKPMRSETEIAFRETPAGDSLVLNSAPALRNSSGLGLKSVHHAIARKLDGERDRAI